MNNKAKLNVWQTVKIGFAFLSICAFWQMYNSVIPLILKNTFKMNETISGAVMAADNVLALFLLPFFGGLSDKCKAKMGKRKPFILTGTIVAVFLMLLLPFIDNRYFATPSQKLELIFMLVLGCLLVAMGTYRSPAISLMPDVTPKPVRSMGNAIINLMGAVGGTLELVVASVLYSKKKTEGLEHVNYMTLFAVVSGIMIVSLIIVMFTVNEAKLAAELLAYEKEHPEENLVEVTDLGEERLPADVKKSLVLILFSIALWFFGYNALETWFTNYANDLWGMSLGGSSICLTVATLGAIASYIPSGLIASRIGRRKTIMTGIALLSACSLGGFIYSCIFKEFSPLLYVLFFVIGLAWAFINVNSLPMVLEICKGGEVGKYTGLYYTFSMSAQIVTPILAGTLFRQIGYIVLFPYTAIFVGLSFITMFFVKHGDSRVERKKGLEAFDVDD